MIGRRLLLRAVLCGLVLLLLPAGSIREEQATSITVFESGGISPEALEEVAALGARVGERHLGTFRLMSLQRDGQVVQLMPAGMGVPMSVTSWAVGDVTDLGDVAPKLRTSGLVISERSASLRGAAVGDVVGLEGWNGELVEVQITDIVADESIGWAEIAVSPTVAGLLGFERVGTVTVAATAADIARLKTRLVDRPIRISGPGQVIDRTDFVLPLVLIKERFGEFAFRPSIGDEIEIDPTWVEANIVTIDVPPLGVFECHRLVAPYVRSAVNDLNATGLLDQIDPADFHLAGGCCNPRLIRGGDRGFALSRHSWGLAIDINPSTNTYDGPVTLTEEFGQTFREWGFAWGAGWLRPDGMHFEWTHVEVPVGRNCSSSTLTRSEIPGVGWRIVERSSPCR